DQLHRRRAPRMRARKLLPGAAAHERRQRRRPRRARRSQPFQPVGPQGARVGGGHGGMNRPEEIDVRNRDAVEAAERAANYEWGFTSEVEQDFAPKGLNEDTVRFISAKK